MEEDRAIHFKALRAKFQEEGLLGRSKYSRPAVAEKPKHVPPSGGHCSSVVSGINMAVESNTPVVPRVFFRDRLRSSGDKRLISFPTQPVQTSPSFQLANGDRTTKHSLKDRNMPLVLPVPSVKDERLNAPSEKELKLELESGKEVPAHDISKKKAMLLSFKSVHAPQVVVDDGEDPTNADLTNRPCSAPALEKLNASMEKQTEDRVSLESDQSASEYPLSSPEISIASSSDCHADSDNRITSTLERDKKMFSRGQMLISTKRKTFLSPDFTSRDNTFLSPRKSPEGLTSPPLCLPHLACISARPFFKTSNSSLKSSFDKQLVRDKADGPSVKSVEPNPSCIPLKKPLLDLQKLGPIPAKPPRPPVVDLTCYHSLAIKSGSPGETWRKEERPEGPPASNPMLDAPEFPDFENVEVDAAVGEAVDIATLELGALDGVGAGVKTHTEFEVTEPALSVCDPAESSKSSIMHGLNLGSPYIIPLDPASFPEPVNLFEFPELPLTKMQTHSQEVDSSANSYEAHLGAAENPSFPEEPELRSQTTSNDESHTHPSDHQQDSYYETSDVYEDVGGISRFVSGQVSTKQKIKLKNPYADSRPKKEGVYVNKWPRHPWVNTSTEYAAHPAHYVHSKEHQSPSTADHKEQRKREKQRLERERKEQKEREKKENEMKKKFKVNGDEEPMYHARVMVASKVRKNDLPVKSGDTVSIIRTTNCPKGKWLARDANNKYGYISVMNVELNIKEMLELGKKAQAAGRGGNLDADTVSIGSRSSTHPVLTSSFTDDSEEWAYEDDTLSPPNGSHIPQTASEPEMAPACFHEPQLPLNESNLEELHTQTRHEALQKLASFFQLSKDEADGGATPTNSETSQFLSSVEEPPYPDTEEEVDFTEVELLPPPPLYADNF